MSLVNLKSKVLNRIRTNLLMALLSMINGEAKCTLLILLGIITEVPMVVLANTKACGEGLGAQTTMEINLGEVKIIILIPMDHLAISIIINGVRAVRISGINNVLLNLIMETTEIKITRIIKETNFIIIVETFQTIKIKDKLPLLDNLLLHTSKMLDIVLHKANRILNMINLLIRIIQHLKVTINMIQEIKIREILKITMTNTTTKGFQLNLITRLIVVLINKATLLNNKTIIRINSSKTIMVKVTMIIRINIGMTTKGPLTVISLLSIIKIAMIFKIKIRTTSLHIIENKILHNNTDNLHHHQ